MYKGRISFKLIKLRKEYERIFGYDPNGDLELEFGNHDEYCELLNTCISSKKDMFEVLGDKVHR